jgi:DNA polymerase V
MLNGEFAVKRLLFQGEKILLQSEGSRSSSIEVTPEDDFQIWGVITYSFRRLRKRKEG